MNRILFSILVMALASACDGNLESGLKQPALTPAKADVTISRGGLPLASTHYSNDSATDYLRCQRDHKQFYIEARKFVIKADDSIDDRMIAFFFPDPTKTASVRTEWTGGSVQLYGKLAPYRSLGGKLNGSCQADLKFDRATQILSGNIACRNFQNTDAGGIGNFDFSIADLSCQVR